ncbi:MAG: excinuclease ABC subunit UvrC, partial [Clostridia bacterium]|nr:excinuclease ABC subunit UvrC [Clostridia bacterium]
MAPTDDERISYLREKAASLPLSPGVYLMKDSGGRIIYVGKSSALKNRVSSYFTDIAHHSVKTFRLVQNIADFDYMLTGTEMEALALENRLIKLHSPKFNIKLKDAKSYPYIKLTVRDEYPRISVVRKRSDDGAKYFGPYSGTGVAYGILNTVRGAFGIPDCRRSFPKDIGTRPCLNYELKKCCGLCTGCVSAEEYRARFREVSAFLCGSFSGVRRELTEAMETAAENLMFENAAVYRDRLAALDRLWDKQRVVGAPDDERDVLSVYCEEKGSCVCIFYVRNGAVTDSECFAFGADRIMDQDALISFIYGLYTVREYIPPEFVTDFPLDADAKKTLSDLLTEKAGRTVKVRIPEKGGLRSLCGVVKSNAEEYLKKKNASFEKNESTLVRLAALLGLEVVPETIEAYDISNLGNENITAGKVLYRNGKPDKSGYRTYKMRLTEGQDDYSSMREAISRRLAHKEDEYPDLILLDGGTGHVSVIRGLLSELGVNIPVFGMVKDEFHKTRELTDDENYISIAHEQPVFLLIYGIQEEVHRYTVSRMSGAKRKTLRRSVLEEVRGIGPAKAKKLLSRFGGLRGVAAAADDELLAV